MARTRRWGDLRRLYGSNSIHRARAPHGVRRPCDGEPDGCLRSAVPAALRPRRGASSGSCAIDFCGTGRIAGHGAAELTLVATSTAATSITGCGFALVVTGTATISRMAVCSSSMRRAPIACPEDPRSRRGTSSTHTGTLGRSTRPTTSSVAPASSRARRGAARTRSGKGDAQVAVYSGTLTVP